MPRFREVLKNRNFFLLWLGQIISQVGDRLGFMALIGFAYSQKAEGSPAQVFKILLFTIIPVFLIGPIAGAYVDRWDRRRTLYSCDLLRMLLVMLIPLFLFHARNLALAYLLIFLVFCLARFFLPAKLSIIPDLVKNDDLLIANSLVNITGMLAFIVGSGISGILVERVGPENGLYLDGASFLLSAALIFFISANRKALPVGLRKIGEDIVEVIKKSLLEEIKEGLRYLIYKKDIRLTAAVLFVLASALGVVSVVSIVFVQNTLHSATKDLGILIMFLGSGLFAGSLCYGRFGERLSHYKAIFVSLILSGVMLIIFALGISRYPCLVLAAILSFLLGVVSSPIMIATNTIVHQASDNEMRGKIFSSLEVIMHLGFLLFMFLSAVLAERFSHPAILAWVGGIFCLLGAVNLIANRRLPWLD